MKKLRRSTALLLALALCLSLFGCSAKAEWSYKTEDKELPIGVYIYSLYAAYNQAASLASELEDYDSEASFLNLEIQGEDDDAPAVASEWIVNNAEKLCFTMLATEYECNRLNVTMPEETLSALQEAAKSDWELGPYYQYYASMGYSSTPYQSILYPYGVSYDSFEYAYYYTNELQYELFCKLYKEGGEKAVGSSELEDFFTQSYTNYSYFTVPLTTTEEDEDGNSTTVELSDEAKEQITDKMQLYADAVNSGEKTWAEAVASYMEDEGVESDPTSSNAEILDDSSLSDEIKQALNSLSENQSVLLQTGSDSSATLYVLYKAPIADAVEDNLGTDDASEAVLINYKGDEFSSYLEEVASSLSISKNSSALNKYKPSMFE